MTNYSGFDWGFNEMGTALGGTSALSMPGPKALNFSESPTRQVSKQYQEFLNKVKHGYGHTNFNNGWLWDNNGINPKAVLGDYHNGMRDINADIKDFEADARAILESGEAVDGHPNQRTIINSDVLANDATGLSTLKVSQYADALQKHRPEIVETVAIPRSNIDAIQRTGGSGLATPGGAEPFTYREQELIPDGGPDMVDAEYMAQSSRRAPQAVDQNGIVFSKYSPGTSPYDAPGRSRIGGISGGARGTQVFSGNLGAVADGSHRRSVNANAAVAPSSNLASGDSVSPASNGGGSPMPATLAPSSVDYDFTPKSKIPYYVGIGAAVAAALIGASILAKEVS